MSDVVARIDDFGRPAWIALMVIGFIVFWPIGLAILAYIIWSGRMGCGWHGSRGDIERWRERLTPWTEQTRMFRNEGFYERFPAKGQIERVSRIHRELARIAGISPRGKQ